MNIPNVNGIHPILNVKLRNSNTKEPSLLDSVKSLTITREITELKTYTHVLCIHQKDPQKNVIAS